MKVFRSAWSVLLVFVTANALAILLQYVSLKPYNDSFIGWAADHKPLYLLSAAVLFFIILGLDGLFDNTYFAVGISTAIIGALCYSQYHKIHLLGEPIYPWDLTQLKHFSEMLNFASNIASPGTVIAAVAAALILLAVTFAIPRVKKKRTYRIVCVIAAAFTIFFCMNIQNNLFAKPLSRMGVVDYNWNQKENYLLNGFMIAFLQNLGSKIQSEPADYNEATMSEIVRKYSTDSSAAAASGAEKPNIVYVMVESLFDPTRLRNVTFSEDPMINLHQYQNTYQTGWSLSPTFGGGTSNVEFEALTGFSISFINDGAVPYQQLLVKMSGIPSIVSLLKAQGYDATAVHPFDGTFYNRNRVYPILGFDRFITQDDIAYKDKLSSCGFISDMSAVKQVVDTLNVGDRPQFVHLVTMQNHLPIQEGMNGANTVTVSGLSGSGKAEMESYAQSVKETDKAIRYLVDAIQNVKRPTIVLVFGDHLPTLEDATFQQGTAGMTAEQKQQFMHETPLLIAANDSLQQKSLGTVSPSFFGPLMFRLAGLQEPPFYQLLDAVARQLPGVSRNVYVDKNGKPSTELIADQKTLLHDYELVQYDLLYGKGYAQSMFH
jgi:phosphoglycerol transferase MdoB-like AlkP superfamily enzyme